MVVVDLEVCKSDSYAAIVMTQSFFLTIRRPPRSTRTDTLFPYTTRFRDRHIIEKVDGAIRDLPPVRSVPVDIIIANGRHHHLAAPPQFGMAGDAPPRLVIAFKVDLDVVHEMMPRPQNIEPAVELRQDRKSTRLNSSH